jgi:transcriptional regulator with XRE-family HTH domain
MRISNIKQADLAKLTGISKGGISNYVIGRYEPKSDIISKLAAALNVSEMWLWGYDVPMKKQNENSSDELMLTEGEKAFIKLLRRIPAAEQPVVIEKILSALDNQE